MDEENAGFHAEGGGKLGFPPPPKVQFSPPKNLKKNLLSPTLKYTPDVLGH